MTLLSDLYYMYTYNYDHWMMIYVVHIKHACHLTVVAHLGNCMYTVLSFSYGKLDMS
jgi:hypothetical protein